jgi:NAD(P)-dependent dehydrogenase (short-subunit alcohol dehydrogenase family)
MRNAIVTGAYGAIGREIARGLFEQGYRVILVGRSRPGLEQLKVDLEGGADKGRARYRVVDLSRKQGIVDMARDYGEPLDVLINNAATAPQKRQETPDGIELQWATNVLGYYWMIQSFLPNLMRAPEGRIVNVASYWAGGLNLDDPEFRKRPYNNDVAYRQSKQANRMLSSGFSGLFEGKIAVNSCHPGDTNSKLSNDLGFGGSEPARELAKTPIYLATDKGMAGSSGGYYVNCKAAHCQFAKNKEGVTKLMELCSGY